MNQTRRVRKAITIDIENIGGISNSSVELESGVTILSGRNATNRTSLLQAVMVALGSENTPLKADASDGRVHLAIGDEQFERTLTRENGTVKAEGTPYLDDSTVADLFAFLLGDNEARRAVERGDELREILMRPVDTGQIESEIQGLQRQKKRLDEQIAEISSLENRLPELEARRMSLETEIEETQAALEAKATDLEQADASVDEKQQIKAGLEAKLAELNEARSELEDVRHDLETERETVAALRNEQDELDAEYEQLPNPDGEELAVVEERLDRLRDRKQALTTDLNQLQNIVQFNEEMLDSSDAELLFALNDDADSEQESVTDRLVDGRTTVTCWTCGSSVQEENITETIDELRDLRERKIQRRREIKADIEDCKSEKDEIEAQQRQREQLERDRSETEDEISLKEERIVDLEGREESLADEVARLESVVEDLEQEDYGEILEEHREKNQLEFEIEQLETDLADVEDEIESVEAQLADRDSLENRRETVQNDIQELRTAVERLEAQTVDAFNTHMEGLIAELDYENIERVWIERVERETRDGRRKTSKGAFELHVVRETETGTVYEDTIENLSESEREVVGLVFALAGYLGHEVHEEVPVILLDSLEAIDADRIATLVEYFADYADYLVVALLSEDATALDDDHPRVSDI